MPLPNQFATQPTGNVPASALDANFNAVAAMGVIPCTATGTNAITLSPSGSVPAVSAYATFQLFGFVASAASTGTITIQVGTLVALPVFLPDGLTQATAGNFALGGYYVVVYNQALNANNGGFQIASTLAPAASAPAVGVSVRQTVQSGRVDSNGLANFISAGTGLACNLSAAATNVNVTFAAGYGSTGGVDFIGQITADMASYWSSLPANTLNFLSVDRNTGTGAITATQTLAPPQYGYAYDRTKQAVLQFGGAAGSTTFLDDFGNAWTAQGGAKVQTNQFKFGTGALGGGGTSNALNGTTDFIKTTNITSLGAVAWSMRCWVQPTALPATNTNSVVMGEIISGNSLGALLEIINNAGTIKFGYRLSSNASTSDIANDVQGTTTPVVGTWYFVELTFDQTAGVYRLYVNGVQEASTTSSLKICSGLSLYVGGWPNSGAVVSLSGYADKAEFLPYCNHPNGTTYTVPAGAPSIAAAGYASDWFSIPAMQMNSVSAASSVAGTNPTFTQPQRVYVGEATTSGSAVTTAITYALQGQYVAPWVFPIPSANTLTSKNDNLGTDTKAIKLEFQNVTVDAGITTDAPPGTILTDVSGFDTTASPRMPPIGMLRTRNVSQFRTGNNNAFMTFGSNGIGAGLNTNSWQYRLVVKRAF